MDQIIRLSKQEAMNLRWVGKARNLQKGAKEFFQTLNKIGQYLVCVDGFKLFATQVPEQLLNSDFKSFTQLTPVSKSPFSSSYHVGLQDAVCDKPKSVDTIFPGPEYQIAAFFVSPKLLKDALDGISDSATADGNHDSVIVRVFKDSTRPDNITPIIVESIDEQNIAVIMCMLGDKEKLQAKHFQLEPAQTAPQNEATQ